MAVDGLEVALADGLQAPINLETLEADSVELITTTATPEMNEGTYFTYNAEIAADNTFAQVQNVGLTNGKIAKEDLDNAFRALFGKTPNMREMHFRFVPYMTDGTSKVLFKKDTYLAATSQKVTPVNLGLEVTTLTTLLKLCNALNINPAELFMQTEIERNNIKDEIINLVKKL